MPHAHHAAFESFLVSVVLILVALVYVRGWVRIRRFSQDTIEGWRAASFLVGLLFDLGGGGLAPGCAGSRVADGPHGPTSAPHDICCSLDMARCTCESRTAGSTAGIRATPSSIRCRGRRRYGKCGRALTHPAVCWFAAAATLVGWHIPALFRLGMQSGTWHGIEHASFLVTGLLFWWPVVQPGSTASKWPEWSIACVSFPGYIAMRYPFRISRLLRPRGVPRLLILFTSIRPVRPRGPTMRRRVDVDLRHRGLPDRRDDRHGAVTLAHV